MSVVRLLLGIVFGIGFTVAVVNGLEAVTEVVWAHQYEETFLSAAEDTSLLVPAALAVFMAVRWPRWRIAAIAALPAVLLTNCAMTVSIFGPVGFGGPPGAGSYLLWASPQPTTPEGVHVPRSYWTAAELNSIHQGSQFGDITFVEPDIPSTRPDVVSVNPIDEYTWGAAAYSWQTGRCYLILDALDPNGRFGNTFYGVLPEGAPCLGSAATRDIVKDSHWPHLPFR